MEVNSVVCHNETTCTESELESALDDSQIMRIVWNEFHTWLRQSVRQLHAAANRAPQTFLLTVSSPRLSVLKLPAVLDYLLSHQSQGL